MREDLLVAGGSPLAAGHGSLAFGVEQRDDVRVVHLRQDLALAAQPLDPLGAAFAVLRDGVLDRDVPAQFLIGGAPNRPVPAGTDLLHQPVSPLIN